MNPPSNHQHSDASDILDFWFGASLQSVEYRKEWFSKDPKFDEAIRSRFLSTYQQGAADQLEGWRLVAESSLAYVLLFDQLPRNIFRNTPQAFATDGKALSCAREAVTAGFDVSLPLLARMFFYLPFEHSEHIDDQHYAVALFGKFAQSAGMEGFDESAKRHCEVIERFGRFPHRNAILGRANTAEEDAFLKQASAWF
jgi:uncharacterized protein (DUF924 family)